MVADDQLVHHAHKIKNATLIRYPDAGHGFLFHTRRRLAALWNSLNEKTENSRREEGHVKEFDLSGAPSPDATAEWLSRLRRFPLHCLHFLPR